MYAGACCPLVNHVEYAPRRLINVRNQTGQTDGRTLDRNITLRFMLDETVKARHCSFV